MPVTDTEQLIREATKAILDADTTLRTLTGRTSRIVLEKDRVAIGVQLPVLAYDLLTFDEASGRAVLLLTAIANDSTNAGQKARAMLEAAKNALTAPAYEAQGLDYIAPQEGTRQSVDEVEDIRGLLDLESPTLTQADWSLPLLVLN